MNPWRDYTPGKSPPDEVDLVVEIPKGSRNKFEVDKDTGAIRLDRVLHAPFRYAWDYGFVPQTLAGDGDPADGLVIMEQATFPGVVVPVRPVGIMHMVDQGEQDDKVIFVASDDPSTKDVVDLADLPKARLDEMREWFSTYKAKEGKETSVTGFEGAAAAKKFIKDAIELYKKEAK